MIVLAIVIMLSIANVYKYYISNLKLYSLKSDYNEHKVVVNFNNNNYNFIYIELSHCICETNMKSRWY
jgi:hypothetical protein